MLVGNKYVKRIGIVIVVIGVILVITGGYLWFYQETEWTWNGPVTTEPYADTGHWLYNIGYPIIVLGCVVCGAGFLVKPPMSEVLRAKRIVDQNKRRLQKYKLEEEVESQFRASEKPISP